MASISVHRPFRTDAARNAVKSLLREGPLEKILLDERLRLTPAKGGEGYKDYSCQTYFTHALNVSIVAAHFLEEEWIRRTEGREETTFEGTNVRPEAVFRILCAAGVLHDLNKLTDMPLREAVRERRDVVDRLLGSYLTESWMKEDTLWLVLSTEGTTSGYAHEYKPSLPGPVISKLQTYLEASDRLTGFQGHANAQAYSIALGRVRPTSEILGEIRILTIVPRPQSLLVGTLRKTVMNHLWDSQRRVLHEGADFISYIGKPIDESDFDQIEKRFREAATVTLEEAQRQCEPSHNKISWTWAETWEPTPQAILAFIDMWKGRLVLWEKAWPTEHSDVLAASPIPFMLRDGRPVIEVPDAEDHANAHKRLPGLIAVCACNALYLGIRAPEEAIDYARANSWDIDNLKGLSLKTATGLAWAAWLLSRPSDIEGQLQLLLKKISEEVPKKYKKRPEPLDGFVRSTLLSPGSRVPAPASASGKCSSCYQCGGTGVVALEAARIHSYGAQDSTGIKLTKLSDTAKGSLCEWCVCENLLRSRTHNTSEGELAVHLHVADLVPDITAEELLTLFKKAESDGIGINVKDELIRFLPKGHEIRLDGHMMLLTSLPYRKSWKEREAAFLLALYNIAISLGIKVRASEMFRNSAPPLSLVVWDNAPAWATNLGLSEASPEGVIAKRDTLKALLNMGGAQGGTDGFGNFSVAFHRNPLHLYLVYNRAIEEGKHRPRKESVERLEEIYMDDDQQKMMDKLARIGVEIAPSPNWSANEHRWVMQEALRAFEFARATREEDEVDFVAAQLSSYASRFLKHPDSELVDRKCRQFAETLRDYLERHHKGTIPSGIQKSYLINHYAYKYRQVYDSVRPKSGSKQERLEEGA